MEGESPRVDPRPWVGATVHFLEPGPGGGSVHRAAIVLQIDESGSSDNACLKVMTPSGDHVRHNVPVASPSDEKVGTWHWPERVE